MPRVQTDNTGSGDLAAHVAAADPHSAYATDTDLTNHAAAADPHTGYVLESGPTFFNQTISATVSANQNNWAPTGFSTAGVIEVTVSGGNRIITGLAGGVAGRVVIITHQGGNSLTFSCEDGLSLSANQFVQGGDVASGDVTLNSGDFCILVYSSGQSRWYVHQRPGQHFHTSASIDLALPDLTDVGSTITDDASEGDVATFTGTLWTYAPGIPVGAIFPYAGAAAPTGYLLCNGASFDSNTYPDLATVLGDTFAAHSGTTYYLPDLRQRFPMGKAASGTGATLGGTGGTIDHLHTGPSHTHTGPSHVHSGPSHTHGNGTLAISNSGAGWQLTDYTRTAGANGGKHDHAAADFTGSTGSGGTADTGAAGTGATGSSGTGDTGTANPPYLVLNYIIRAWTV